MRDEFNNKAMPSRLAYSPKNLHKRVETLSRRDGINQSGLEGKMGSMNSNLVGDVMHDGRNLGAA